MPSFFADALAIYLLNLFLAFLQPKFDPSIQQDLAAEDVEEGAPGLPGGNNGSAQKGGGPFAIRVDATARLKVTSIPGLSGLMSGFSSGENDEEFRPFIRRLPGPFRQRLWL